jgi:glycosyltransferase involved in cell wall biosynthesis
VLAGLSTLQIGMTATPGRGGGVDRYFLDLLRALPTHGVVARGLVTGKVDDRRSDVPGLVSFAPDEVNVLRRWAGLRRVAASLVGRSDVVVSHFAPYAFPLIDMLRGRPFVVHFHGAWAAESALEGQRRAAVLIKRALELAVYRRAARFIVLSKASASILAREYGVDEAHIRVVPGGVDRGRFAPGVTREAARAALGWPRDRPIVLAVRRLARVKGLEGLIDAMAAVVRAQPDALLVVAGTGPLRGELVARAAARALGDTVRFVGHVGETLPLAYRAADLSIVPTRQMETFGLVVLESLASGTPALVTPVGALPDVAAPLEPALVLDGTDANAIARGILDALRGRLPLPDAERCIAYARDFTWPRIAARVRDVYAEVA